MVYLSHFFRRVRFIELEQVAYWYSESHMDLNQTSGIKLIWFKWINYVGEHTGPFGLKDLMAS